MSGDVDPELPDGVRLDVAAVLARELGGDVNRLVSFLGTRLCAVLPGAVVVKRRGLLGRGPVSDVKVVAGDAHYELALGHGGSVRATVGHAVSGVVLQRDPLPLGDWIRQLLVQLETMAAQSAEIRAALEGLT